MNQRCFHADFRRNLVDQFNQRQMSRFVNRGSLNFCCNSSFRGCYRHAAYHLDATHEPSGTLIRAHNSGGAYRRDRFRTYCERR